MKEADFIAEMPGELVQTLDGQPAFVPQPLPPSFDWTMALANALSTADRAVGNLAGISANSGGGINPQLLVRPYMAREAKLSSQIEGTVATVSDLLLFEEGAAVETQVPDVREVYNYTRALQHGIDTLSDRPLTLGLIKELHHILMDNVRGGDKTPGAFRTGQVFLGKTKRIEDATFIPPPSLFIQPGMEALERYIRKGKDLPPLVRLAIIHYQFESIHPFNDGNGRIGRLLIVMLLCAEKILPSPLLYLSAYFESHKDSYYRGLREVSQQNRWAEWIIFFLDGVTAQAIDAVERTASLAALRSSYRKKFQSSQRSVKLLQLVDELFQSPAMGVSRAAKILELTPAATQGNIDKLLAEGVLTEVTGQARHRIYMAKEIIRVLNE